MTETTDDVVRRERGKRILATLGFKVDGPTPDVDSDDEWKRSAARWRLTLTRDGRSYSADYWTGSGIVTYRRKSGRLKPTERIAYNHYGPGRDAIASPRPPEVTDALYSLALDASLGDQPFVDFCADLGYDTDSRSAHASWSACLEVRFALRSFFGADFDEFITTDWEDIA